MKRYLDRDWLLNQYIILGKSTIQIARENDCTDANILRVMRRLKIPRRSMLWSDKDIEIVVRFAGKQTWKEIAEMTGKTYEAVRIKASKLGLKSAYNPGFRDEMTRQKISASLQGIAFESWDGYKETENAIIRKSVPYLKWRLEVFRRDNYTCQFCGVKSSVGRKVYLHADHIKRFAEHPELRFELSNGRTLCVDCHRKTPTWGGRKAVSNGL